MKNILSLLLIILFGNVAFSQNDEIVLPGEVETHSYTEEVEIFNFIGKTAVFNPNVCLKLPESERYNCTQEEVKKYISENLKYPPIAQKNDIEGKVYVRFQVDTLGKVTNVVIVKGADILLDTAAIELISNMPDFIPAENRGVKVEMSFVFPVIFKIP